MKTIGALVAERDIYHLSADQTVREASRYMTERRVGAVSVLEGTRLVGILSERDIMGRVVAKGLDPDRTRVGDVMTRDLVVAPETDRIITVIENTHVPVLPPKPEIPFRMTLRGPTPNPFRGGTTMVFELTQATHVSVVIYDVTGRRVRSLVDRVLSAGTQYVGWDGTDDLGRHAGRGLYFYRAQAGGRTEVRKLMALGD